jgi:TatD family-associated radical SAM protein
MALRKDAVHMSSAIAYTFGNALYLNITNRCSNSCTFCLRSHSSGIRDGLDLWLKREPGIHELIQAIDSYSVLEYSEVVFCGYGEPTSRLHELIATCQHLKRTHGARIRLDTNGQGSLINNRDIAPSLDGLVDSVSISLNAANSESYQQLCRSVYAREAFPAVIEFAKKCVVRVPDVVLTVVDVLGDDEMRACREIAVGMGAQFRVRPFVSARSARDGGEVKRSNG